MGDSDDYLGIRASLMMPHDQIMHERVNDNERVASPWPTAYTYVHTAIGWGRHWQTQTHHHDLHAPCVHTRNVAIVRMDVGV